MNRFVLSFILFFSTVALADRPINFAKDLNIQRKEHQVVVREEQKEIKLAVTDLTVPNSKGTVLLMHGLLEQSGRYKYLAEFLLKNEFSVVLFDHRGHGKSEGERGYIEKFDSFVSDLDEVINYVNNNVDNRPIFVGGHSMGGLISFRHGVIGANKNNVKGYIFLSPAVTVNLTLLESVKVFLGTKIIPSRSKHYLAAAAEDLVSTADEVKRYKADNLALPHFTVKLGLELVEASRQSFELAAQWSTPVFIGSSAGDKLINNDSNNQLFEMMSEHAYVERKIYPSTKHEIINSKKMVRESIFNDILKFILSNSN